PGCVAGRGDVSPTVGAPPGTLDCVFSEYRSDRRFTELYDRTRRNHELGFRLVGGFLLSDGRRLGQVRLASVTSDVIDTLYDRLLLIKKTDAAGNVIERERRTTVNHAMKTCRRAWNVPLDALLPSSRPSIRSPGWACAPPTARRRRRAMPSSRRSAPRRSRWGSPR